MLNDNRHPLKQIGNSLTSDTCGHFKTEADEFKAEVKPKVEPKESIAENDKISDLETQLQEITRRLKAAKDEVKVGDVKVEDQDIISISSDDSDNQLHSDVEDVTELLEAKRREDKCKMVREAEEIYDSDGEGREKKLGSKMGTKVEALSGDRNRKVQKRTEYIRQLMDGKKEQNNDEHADDTSDLDSFYSAEDHFDDESSDASSSSSDSDIEVVTELLMAKRNQENEENAELSANNRIGRQADGQQEAVQPGARVLRNRSNRFAGQQYTDADYDDFWHYAFCVSEEAARRYYGARSPPVGASNPYESDAADAKLSPQPNQAAQNKAKQKKKKPVEPKIQVIIADKDLPACPGGKAECNAGEKSENAIKLRVVKLLNTGFHETSNEYEARNALRLAHRLCERYNLDQALLLQERGDGSLGAFSGDGSSLEGGMVAVELQRKGNKPLLSRPRWISDLAHTVGINFHVEWFQTRPRRTSFKRVYSMTFYGIRTDCEYAAYAFKVSCERISIMAESYNPPRYGSMTSAMKATETKNARLSYAIGIVRGLKNAVKRDLQEEEEKRKNELKIAQIAVSDESQLLAEKPMHCPIHFDGGLANDDYDADDFDGPGFSLSGVENKVGCSFGNDLGCETRGISLKSVDDTGFDGGGKYDSSNECRPNDSLRHAKSFATVDHLDRLERENNAQLALIDHRKKIASDVLKANNINLRSGQKLKSLSLNRRAYQKGIVDSKQIDLNQRAIKE